VPYVGKLNDCFNTQPVSYKRTGVYSLPKGYNFTTTIFNISVTSSGRQYDRLAELFLSDTEVWQTSTAMPAEKVIFWSYQKEI